jgi:hypothetical protein
MSVTAAARPIALGTVTVVAAAVLRAWQRRWGATDDEVNRTLPGDDLISHADLTATRAITIHTTAAQVWPWIAQLGQGRGGFYSYDFLENLVGCDIHSADRIVPEWQRIDIGDRSNSLRRSRSAWPWSCPPARWSCAAGSRWGTRPRPTTSPGRRAARGSQPNQPAGGARVLPLHPPLGAAALLWTLTGPSRGGGVRARAGSR